MSDETDRREQRRAAPPRLRRTSVPELDGARLLLADPRAFEAPAPAGALATPPFWAFCWGSGRARAAWLAAHPEQVAGRHVYDFGSGSGIVAIAAARVGAGPVTAVDRDPAALRASRLNARACGVTLGLAPALPEPLPADALVLAADTVYADAAANLLEWLAAAGAEVIVADARGALADLPVHPLARCRRPTLPAFGEAGHHAEILIARLRAPSQPPSREDATQPSRTAAARHAPLAEGPGCTH